MFIRRTVTRRTEGRTYHTHRLVRSERDGEKVRQRTLLNLGAGFDLPKVHWPMLCQRIEAIQLGQAPLGSCWAWISRRWARCSCTGPPTR